MTENAGQQTRHMLKWPALWLDRDLTDRIAQMWRTTATRYLMDLALPGAVLGLGADVRWLSSGQMYPDDLERATFPPLVEVLAKLDRTSDTVTGSAAKDWSDLGDRMNFIVDVFRAHQQDARLYGPPFTDEQVAVILRDGMPSGQL
jgi:hypothetical protein